MLGHPTIFTDIKAVPKWWDLPCKARKEEQRPRVDGQLGVRLLGWRIGTCNCTAWLGIWDSQIQIVSSINLSSSALSKFGIYMKLRESSIFPNIFPSMKLKSSTQTPKPWTFPQPEGVAVAILLRLRFARDCHTSEGTAGHGGIALDKARNQALR